ncbi:MAG: NusA-like transcription termination signal-binding factor [Candidatus Aenigmarchaeota archaeon]|nr:NusA-like transcription termination signal-binding factor [Candidatus Aenigmarchaeota archaeon]MBS3053681.1 NusA-like transcription termination signal-binding factor [Candidatus Aenigmarchaeota archaeon]
MKVTLDARNIQSISLFQNLTNSSVLDCLEESDMIFFVVSEGQYGLAVGKNGSKIKNAERVFKKTIKVFEYSPDLNRFVSNLIPEALEVNLSEKGVQVKIKPNDKPKVIGKGGKNIRIVTKFLQRLFDVENLKIK